MIQVQWLIQNLAQKNSDDYKFRQICKSREKNCSLYSIRRIEYRNKSNNINGPNVGQLTTHIYIHIYNERFVRK